MAKKWFQEAVEAGRTKNLNGWSKTQPASERRRRALASRVSNYSLHDKALSAGRALQSLVNVTEDRATRIIAKSDADYFFAIAKRTR